MRPPRFTFTKLLNYDPLQLEAINADIVTYVKWITEFTFLVQFLEDLITSVVKLRCDFHPREI